MDNKLQNIALGVDIGGSHITAVAVNMETKKIISGTASGAPVDNDAEAHEIIAIWSDAIRNVLDKINLFNVRGIGFAMPGPFDYVNGICLIRGVQKYEKLYGINIGKAISSKLGLPCDCKVRFMNDASSFAVGEAWAGKAKDFSKAMAITIGTGFGSAFLEDKVPVVDGPLVPKMGCVYHLPFEKSIADDYFSTRWLVGRYHEVTGKNADGAKEVADAAKKDPAVKAIFNEFGENLGLFLTPWLIKFGVEVLVIGGNISNAYDLFAEKFESKLKLARCKTHIEISGLKEDAALLGSAYLLDESFWKAIQHALPLM
jgi:glucokinase